MVSLLLSLVLAQPATSLSPMRVRIVGPTDGGSPVSTSLTGFPSDSTGAFGSLMTVQETPVHHLDFSDNYANPEILTTTLDGGGYVVADGGRLFLGVPGGTTASAFMQSRQTTHYIPGQGMTCRFTFAQAATCQLNQRTEIGCGTANDGFFFGCCPSCEADGGTAFGVLRRSAGVDNWTPASSWNGTYGTTAPDITKGRPYQISYQWLGYGQISYFAESEATGRFTPVHIIRYAGTSTETSVRDPTFPLRVGIVQTGSWADGGSISSPSMGMYRQGSSEGNVGLRRASSNSKAISTAAQLPILSIQNKSSFNGLPNYKALVVDFISWNTSGSANADATITLWLNAGLYGTATFDDFSANSFAATNTAATGIDGGGVPTMVFQGAANVSETQDLHPYRLVLRPGDVLTITGISLAGTPNLRVAASWTDDF